MTTENDRLHELLALELYDEVDAADRAELARLESESPERARTLRAELSQGLGALDPELPSQVSIEWRDAVLAATRAESPRTFRTRWLAVAASFAAGLFVGGIAWRASPPAPPGEAPTTIAMAVDDLARFATDAPPPRATAGGSLARLGAYLR